MNMLNPMLFIGCGGSGLRTLRRLRRELEFRLEVAGIPKELFPEVWQFIVVDVPSEEQIDNDLAGFSANDYVGLADTGMGFLGANGVDKRLINTELFNVDYAQWRPDPTHSHVDITKGAGQFRSVGRAVGVNSLRNKLEPKVNTALAAMQSEQAREGSKATAKSLGISRSGSPELSVILVSSLGGGAGSGIFVDVADALRMMNSPALKKSIAFLYSPSIFASRSPLNSSGISPNSLAALSEAVAGKWSPWKPPAHLRGAEDPGPAMGPLVSLIFGESNGTINLMGGGGPGEPGAPDSVYEMLAQILADQATAENSKFVEDTLGNMAQNSARSPSSPALQDVTETITRRPFTSIGFSKVSLGRGRFARYASERLTRDVTKKIMSAHEDADVIAGTKTVKARVEELVGSGDLDGGKVKGFLIQAGLNESGATDNDQVIDAIRPSATIAEVVTQLQTHVHNTVRAADRIIPQFTTAWENNALVAGSSARYELPSVRKNIEDSAATWASSIQGEVLQLVVQWVARYGLLVAVEVLRQAVEQVGKDFPAELRAEAIELGNQFKTNGAKTAAVIKQFTPRRNGTIPTNITTVLDTLVRERVISLAERDLREVSAKLLEDMAASFLEPLLKSLADSAALLDREYKSEAYTALASAAVPTRLRPAANEVLIDKVEDYPQLYTDLMKAAAAGSVEAAQVSVFAAEIGDEARRNDLPLALQTWRITSHWVPDVASSTGGVPAKLGVSFAFSVNDVQRRALAWMKDGQATLAKYLNQNMRTWLTESSSQAEIANRADELSDRLDTAFGMAKPFVELNDGWLATQFGYPAETSFDVSGIPLLQTDSEIGYQKLDSTVGRYINDGAVRQALFNDDVTGDILIYSTLLPMCPSGMRTLTLPITNAYTSALAAGADAADQFGTSRRSRPLAEFIPLPDSSRLTLVRGWINARLLNKIEMGEDGRSCKLEQAGVSFTFLSPTRKLDGGWDWLGWLLESALLAQMMAAHGSLSGFDALTALMKYGTKDGSDKASKEYSSRSPLLATGTLDGLKNFASDPDMPPANVEEAMRALISVFKNLTISPEEEFSRLAAQYELKDLVIRAAMQIQNAPEFSESQKGQGGVIG
jgi:hypothetical protein